MEETKFDESTNAVHRSFLFVLIEIYGAEDLTPI